MKVQMVCEGDFGPQSEQQDRLHITERLMGRENCWLYVSCGVLWDVRAPSRNAVGMILLTDEAPAWARSPLSTNTHEVVGKISRSRPCLGTLMSVTAPVEAGIRKVCASTPCQGTHCFSRVKIDRTTYDWSQAACRQILNRITALLVSIYHTFYLC